MKVYFSGISGTGIGPLAELAHDAGFEVFGSDLTRGAIADELDKKGIEARYGEQDGNFLIQKIETTGVDWLVHTSALPKQHRELQIARERNIKTSKRDEFLAELIRIKNLKMVAIAGTHGKTTTTAMLVWLFKTLNIPVSYLVGTTLGWAESGKYDAESEYFIYEADEYDRNFLAFHPYISAITTIDYDHPDIYPTREDYQAAFRKFESQSDNVVKNTTLMHGVNLIGALRRIDGSLAVRCFGTILKKSQKNTEKTPNQASILDAINRFPGAGRRFEKIERGVISDYGHHPSEIALTLEMARELKERDHYGGVAVIYQPHQNTRQHEIRREYKNAFTDAGKIFWLPTYLTREDPQLEILSADTLIKELDDHEKAEAAEMNEVLIHKLQQLHKANWLIVLLSAGPADQWLRENLASITSERKTPSTNE
ncbi:hypothetical protein IKF15_03410 [Candidatus Saccharibacteria bacterium]|nr:hypothetical protein [Candidatus Saccharibacteria bacterium]